MIQLLRQPVILISAIVLLFAVGCSDSGTGADESLLETNIAENIPANAGAARDAAPDYTFYDLENGIVIEDSLSGDWDLGFSATSIIANGGQNGPGQGGIISLDVAFPQVTLAPSEGYSGAPESDWYNYTGQQTQPLFAVIPKEDFTMVVKTGNGENYAKIRILSYYYDNPETSSAEFANLETRPDDRYYTFEYTIQLNGSRDLQ
ncbi:MAG: hypothetical protein GVY02_09565 [Bacteroidetes bacterium]|nr:hypothetical protein [Bacteroidota bacterium]